MKRVISRSRPRKGVLLGAVFAAIFAMSCTSAYAVVVQMGDGSRLSYQPLPGTPKTSSGAGFSNFVPLINHGGPVMATNTNYLIFWQGKSGKYASKFTAGITAYMKNLAADSGKNTNVDSIASQYGATYGSTFGGVIKDKTAFPPSGCTHAPICLTDEQIRAEITKVVESKKLPQTLSDEYFLLTPEGVESCFNSLEAVCSANSNSPYYCAYHSWIGTAKGPIVYSNDPYVYQKLCDEPNHPNGAGDSALLGGLSHEHVESITDPQLNAWFNEYGEEIGDICRSFEPASEFGPVLGKAKNGASYNQVVNKKFYWYQQEWSNSGNACKQHI